MHKRVAEIMHFRPEDKDAYIEKFVHMDQETKEILWMHGIRRQFFYELGENQMLYVFGYDGKTFRKDMEALTTVFAAKNMLITKRLRDVKPEERDTTNWWAPLKRLGASLIDSPLPDEADEDLIEESFQAMADRVFIVGNIDTSYDEDDWSETISI